MTNSVLASPLSRHLHNGSICKEYIVRIIRRAIDGAERPSHLPAGIGYNNSALTLIIRSTIFFIAASLIGSQCKAETVPEQNLASTSLKCFEKKDWPPLNVKGAAKPIDGTSSYGGFVLASRGHGSCVLGFKRPKTGLAPVMSDIACPEPASYFTHTRVIKSGGIEFHMFESGGTGNAIAPSTDIVVIDGARQCYAINIYDIDNTETAIDSTGPSRALRIFTTGTSSWTGDTAGIVYRIDTFSVTHQTILRHPLQTVEQVISGQFHDDTYKVFNFMPGVKLAKTGNELSIENPGKCNLNAIDDGSNVILKLAETTRSDSTKIRRCVEVIQVEKLQ